MKQPKELCPTWGYKYFARPEAKDLVIALQEEFKKEAKDKKHHKFAPVKMLQTIRLAMRW